MKYKPGQIVPQSGIYAELNINNQKLTEVTCVKNERFPPTVGHGYHYELVRGAIHRPTGG